ncbi:chromatin binding protein [Leucoagaricus gongylophorus]
MNNMINPFQITHPTAIQTSLLASAHFSKFDPSGRWIAAGKQNGSVVIWDLSTRAPVRVLDGHVKSVTSVE